MENMNEVIKYHIKHGRSSEKGGDIDINLAMKAEEKNLKKILMMLNNCEKKMEVIMSHAYNSKDKRVLKMKIVRESISYSREQIDTALDELNEII